jgi:putative heme iron utilization protein
MNYHVQLMLILIRDDYPSLIEDFLKMPEITSHSRNFRLNEKQIKPLKASSPKRSFLSHIYRRGYSSACANHLYRIEQYRSNAEKIAWQSAGALKTV